MCSSFIGGRSLLTQRARLPVLDRHYSKTPAVWTCVDSRLAHGSKFNNDEGFGEHNSGNKRRGNGYFKYSAGAALLIAGLLLSY